VNQFIATGQKEKTILTLGFDLDQWNKRKSKRAHLNEEKKSEIISKIIDTIHQVVQTACYSKTAGELLNANKSHFFELKAHLESLLRKEGNPQLEILLQDMKTTITGHKTAR
jgi:translation initiation factor 2B subunit (eIF-2B alpha/beta/delta family)